MRTAVALLLYIGALGAHRIVPPTPLAPGELTVSLVADDTDLDDDVLSTACMHTVTFDDGGQDFEQSAAPRLAFSPEVRRLVVAASPAVSLLGDGGLFRPPRTLLF